MRAAILILGLVGGAIALGLGAVGSLLAPRTTSIEFYGAAIVGGLLAFAACGLLRMFRDDPGIAALLAAPAAVGALLALYPVVRRP